MILEVFSSGPLDTNGILIGCPQTFKAALFDAPLGISYPLERAIKKYNLQLETIYLTHSHWDHTGEAAELKALYACALAVHPLDAPNVQNPGADGLPLLFPIEGAAIDFYLEDQGNYSIGSLHFQAIHTPGHSPGGMGFYFPKQEVLISGDTLFHGAIGNLSLPTAQPQKMRESLQKFIELPLKTRVYPGHGPSTTIQDELRMIRSLLNQNK